MCTSGCLRISSSYDNDSIWTALEELTSLEELVKSPSSETPPPENLVPQIWDRVQASASGHQIAGSIHTLGNLHLLFPLPVASTT